LPLFDKHKLIFHHVPKTGGRAITEWLGGGDAHVGHLPVMFMHNQLDIWDHAGKGILPDRKNYNTFSIMRSPMERIRSGFEHIKANDITSFSDNTLLKLEFEKDFDGDFNDFLLSDNLKDIILSKNATLLRPLTWMFCDNSKDPKNPVIYAPDFILSFDNLDEDTVYLNEKLNLNIATKFKLKRSIYQPIVLSARAYKRAQRAWAYDFKIYEFFCTNFHIKNIL